MFLPQGVRLGSKKWRERVCSERASRGIGSGQIDETRRNIPGTNYCMATISEESGGLALKKVGVWILGHRRGSQHLGMAAEILRTLALPPTGCVKFSKSV